MKNKFQDLPAFIKEEEREVDLSSLMPTVSGNPGSSNIVDTEINLEDKEGDVVYQANEESGVESKHRRNKVRAAKKAGSARLSECFLPIFVLSLTC